MKTSYRNITDKNAKKPLWTKIVTAVLVVIAIDMALLLIDFSHVLRRKQQFPPMRQATITQAWAIPLMWKARRTKTALWLPKPT